MTGILTGAAALLLLAAGAAPAQMAGPAGDSRTLPPGYVFNIVDWEGGALPPLYERSDQLPMSLDDVVSLSKAKFSEAMILKMLEERRCACDASVSALVRLKDSGVAEKVIQAMSLHALPPNRSLDLAIHMDFEGLGGAAVSSQAHRAYLYLIIPDGERERVFFGSLNDVLGQASKRGTAVDNTDLLLPKQVRRVSFVARVPLKVPGTKRALVFTSTRPNIYTEADIPEADRKGVQEFRFGYPASSLQRFCSLQVLHRQDAMLANRWHMERSHFECEWE
jgi:hypothetical protein